MPKDDDNYLSGHLLLAMPGIRDPRFEKSVIYMCAHSSDGAMGLVVNKPLESLSFPDLLEQLGIEPESESSINVHFGGPVESGRGFVLHSDEYLQEATMTVDSGIALTATIDILRDIATGGGPRRSLLALGYAGWSAGQLDSEIKDNGWLHVSPDEDLVFGPDMDTKWESAMGKLGIDPLLLSEEAGHA
jgi:putative transcriptional regulator